MHTSAQRERKKERLISERDLSAYHRDADNAASGSARDSLDVANASANAPPSGMGSPGCPSQFPFQDGNALFGVLDSHPSSLRRFARKSSTIPRAHSCVFITCYHMAPTI